MNESEIECFESVIPGLSVGGGKVVGGVYKRTTVEVCNHKSTIELMKQQALKNSNNWNRISMGSALLAFVFLLCWYFTKVKSFCGAAVLSVLWAFFCLIMAEIVLSTWIIALVAIGGAVLIGIGYMVKHKTITSLWRKDKCRTSHETTSTT